MYKNSRRRNYSSGYGELALRIDIWLWKSAKVLELKYWKWILCAFKCDHFVLWWKMLWIYFKLVQVKKWENLLLLHYITSAFTSLLEQQEFVENYLVTVSISTTHEHLIHFPFLSLTHSSLMNLYGGSFAYFDGKV